MLDKLLDFVLELIDGMFVFELPSLPDSTMDVFETAVGYISNGFKVLCSFVGFETVAYLMVLLGLVIALNAVYALYSMVAWVIHKIPVLNIKLHR